MFINSNIYMYSIKILKISLNRQLNYLNFLKKSLKIYRTIKEVEKLFIERVGIRKVHRYFRTGRYFTTE